MIGFRVMSVVILLSVFRPAFSATVYEVGPGKAYTNINDVPLDTLGSGDTVKIFYRSTPYAEKFLIYTGGTASAPITITGVPDIDGNLPVITGENATSAPGVDYPETLGLIVIAPRVLTRDPDTTTDPDAIKYIVIENLELRSARDAYSFTDHLGANQTYAARAAGIQALAGDTLTIRNCVIHDCGNGLFTAYQTRNVLVESCYIYDNGKESSIYIHNAYTESQGIIYQYNRFGPLRSGCGGNNLKDRSIGTVIRYNWIEGGNRELDLVNVDDPDYSAEHYDVFVNDPDYWTAYVYGNVIIEPGDDGNAQICQFGGDVGGYGSYKTQLYFYDNTVISKRTGWTSLFMLSRNEQYCDARNNIIYVTQDGADLGMLDGPDYSRGHLTLRRNFIKPGWVDTHYTLHTVATIDVIESNIELADPGFTNFSFGDYSLAAGSPCINTGIAIASECLPQYDVLREYLPHLSSIERSDTDDLGAFRYVAVAPGVLQFSSVSYSVAENAGTLTITITRTAGSDGTARATVTGTDGTAVAGTDFSPVNQTVIFGDGDTASKTVFVTILDNAVYYGDRHFVLDLATTTPGVMIGANASSDVAIQEDDSPPPAGALMFSAESYSVGESDGTLTVSVTRFGGTSGTVSVSVTSQDGSATALDGDYDTVNTSLTWVDGEGGVKTVAVTIDDDLLNEGTETFTLNLTAATGGAVIAFPDSVTVSILDNDAKSKSSAGCTGAAVRDPGFGFPLIVWVLFASVGAAFRKNRVGACSDKIRETL